MTKQTVVVRGGGDLASGVIHRLHRCGYRVLILECEKPSAIRRMVSFCEAVYDGEAFVEGVLCRRIEKLSQCDEVLDSRRNPSFGGRQRRMPEELEAAGAGGRHSGKKKSGNCAGDGGNHHWSGAGLLCRNDVDYVVETKRGHNLGRPIEEGCAAANTGIPGIVGGFGKERVIHAPCAGILTSTAQIADIVEQGQEIAYIGDTRVRASLTGVLRGMIRDGYEVYEGMKIADIDPRKDEKENCYTISDKARCIAGGVVEILLSEGVLPYGAAKKLSEIAEN